MERRAVQMENWEYLEVQVNPDEHYYIRRHMSRRKSHPIHEPPEIVYYPGTYFDVAKIAAAQGWEIVMQAANRSYLFKRRLNG